MGKVKKKRQLKPGFKILLILLVVGFIAGIFYLPTYLTNRQLKELGYSNVTIKNIREEELVDIILENGYYSTYLTRVINEHTINKDYIKLYTIVPDDRTLTDDDFLLYNRLADIGYEEDQLENLFANLTYQECLPLLVFDYQWDENPYIEDIKENREENGDTVTTLSRSYTQAYVNTNIYDDPTATDILINRKNGLPDAYEPDDLVSLSTQYSVADMYLRKEVQIAFETMAQAAESEGHYFFATDTYHSQDYQSRIYQNTVNTVGESYADYYATRARYSEHETGLAVNIIPTFESSDDFLNTEVYAWLKDNCATYGFILRYPDEKSLYTSVEDEPNHFRYVGVEIAKAVQETGLSYEEFYMLYIADWEHDDYIPSQSILDATNPIQSK